MRLRRVHTRPKPHSASERPHRGEHQPQRGFAASPVMSNRSARHIPVTVEGFGDAELTVHARVIDIADLVHSQLIVCPHVLAVMKTINQKYPKLSFGDFLVAMKLVELAAREPRGNA